MRNERKIRTVKMFNFGQKLGFLNCRGLFASSVKSDAGGKGGFTLIEVMVVVVILVIASMMVVPMASSASSFQIRSATNMIAADMEYAKSMAIATGQMYSVVFDAGSDSYQINDQNNVVIAHPVNKGTSYIVNFRNDSRLNQVDIVSANFVSTSATTSVIKFDYLGSPYDGGGNPLNSGTISLKAGMTTMTITVQPVTGFISVSN